MSHFSYHLRICIDPHYFTQQRCETLLTFCRHARIDEVMFFFDCEELNVGHITLEQLKPWLVLIAQMKQRLAEMGIQTSINPWETILHTDRGRTLQRGQDFRQMVDPYGHTATAVVCPLCENWRAYIKDIYTACAQLKPHVLWIEDDFRLHNHGPLIWGGCFCQEQFVHNKEIQRF